MSNEISEYLEVYEYYKIKYSNCCLEKTYAIQGKYINSIKPEVEKRYEECNKESLLREADRLLLRVSELSTASNKGFGLIGQSIEEYVKLLCLIFNKYYKDLKCNKPILGFDSLPIYFTVEEVDKLFKPILKYSTKDLNKDN